MHHFKKWLVVAIQFKSVGRQQCEGNGIQCLRVEHPGQKRIAEHEDMLTADGESLSHILNCNR